MSKLKWTKKLVSWVEDDTVLLSIPFTWELPVAYSLSIFLRGLGYRVRVGGPAVSLMPEYLRGVAECGGEVDALRRHNPHATFTSRGCVRECPYCAVPRIEGELKELDSWEPRPIVCDNNLLACSRRHFDRVIDSLKGLKDVDFNQGLDVRLLTKHHAERIAELNLKVVRLSWDSVNLESRVMTAIEKLLKVGIPKRKIGCYVLINFDDTPEDALYRLETLKAKGIRPNPQRYNPLNALQRDTYVSPNWTDRELKRFMRYWSRQRWLEHIPFEDYR
ncbi:hypothetical protein M1N20_02980 [Dehalococcoidia bacterium]|nr:hypothetical protein [Dehalococcoidia bacterium]